LIIRTADLAPEGKRIAIPLEIGPLTSGSQDPIRVSEVFLEGEIRPANRGVILRGVLKARAELACARCLESFGVAMAREFVLRYAPAAPAGKDIHIAEEDLDLGFLEPDGGLDLAQVALEQIFLEIPMKPLCRPDCRGLCVNCGANLNNEPCRCANLVPRS